MNQCRYVLAVRDFHRKGGHVVNVEPTIPPPGVTVQRQRLIFEEMGELASAFHERDIIEFADGLADFVYVVVGTAVAYGVGLAECWADTVEKRYAPIYAPKICSYDLAMQQFSRMSKAISRLFMGMAHANLPSIQEFISELMERAFEFAWLCGIPLAAVIDEVHSSNMSKNLVPTNGIDKYSLPTKLVKGEGYHPPDVARILGVQPSVSAAEAGK